MLELFGGVIVGGLAGLCVMLMIEGVASYWRGFRATPTAPAKWQITMSDPDGIPMRSDSVSAAGIARLVKDINSGFYK